MEGFADLLRAEIKRVGPTMRALALRAGVPYRSLQDYVGGHSKPGWEALEALSAAGVDINRLLGRRAPSGSYSIPADNKRSDSIKEMFAALEVAAGAARTMSHDYQKIAFDLLRAVHELTLMESAHAWDTGKDDGQFDGLNAAWFLAVAARLTAAARDLELEAAVTTPKTAALPPEKPQTARVRPRNSNSTKQLTEDLLSLGGLTTFAQLADCLGVSPACVAGWRMRDTIPKSGQKAIAAFKARMAAERRNG